MDSKRIDVEEKFSRQDLPSTEEFQPNDYTPYATGTNKTRIQSVIAKTKVLGSAGFVSKVVKLIPQRGLAKRNAERTVFRTQDKLLQKPRGVNRPVQNVGVLSAADRFFNWLNGVIGGG